MAPLVFCSYRAASKEIWHIPCFHIRYRSFLHCIFYVEKKIHFLRFDFLWSKTEIHWPLKFIKIAYYNEHTKAKSQILVGWKGRLQDFFPNPKQLDSMAKIGFFKNGNGLFELIPSESIEPLCVLHSRFFYQKIVSCSLPI